MRHSRFYEGGKFNGLWLMAQTESGGKNSVLFWQPFPASFELFTCEVWNVVKLENVLEFLEIGN